MRKPAAGSRSSSGIVVYELDIPTQGYETLAHIHSDVWITSDGEYVSINGDPIRDAAKQEAIKVAAELGGEAVILSYHYVASVSCISPVRGVGRIRGTVVRFITN